MDSLVFAAVLFAAACHAGWNAAIKRGLDPLAGTVSIAIGSAVVAIPLLLVTGLPIAAAWPWVIASVVIHLFYFAGLIESYRAGDMGQVYPIARGTAPLVTAVLATALLGEALGPFGWTGVIVLAAGILLLALRGGRSARGIDARSVGFALLTSATITAYTLVDGIGARTAGSAAAYTVWLFLASGAVMTLYGLYRFGPGLVRHLAANRAIALGGAALSTAAYAIAIWAMTVAPIALVAALRETSVLFATLLSTLLLREPWLAARIAATLMVLAGALLLRVR
jgi:drug/metabolite transporter (DMT)-like permease